MRSSYVTCQDTSKKAKTPCKYIALNIQETIPWICSQLLALSIIVCLILSIVLIPHQLARAQTQATSPRDANRKSLVTLNFVGDILLASRIEDLINAEGPMAPWLGVKYALQDADFTIGSLECSVGTTGSPMPDKQYTFRASPETLESLKEAGVNVVSLANNHTLDFGVDCLLETVENVKQYGIIPVGAGHDEQTARAPVILEKNGIKIGVFATSMVIPVQAWAADGNKPGLAVDYSLWNENIVSRLEELRPQVDFTVVYLHWGEERTTAPEDWVLRMERVLRKAGADIIIGSHPHVLRGFRFNGKALTAHSLGNFVFTTNLNCPACQIGAILRVTVSKDGIENAAVVPTKIVFGKTVMLEDKEKAETLATLNSLSQPFETDIDQAGQLWEKPFPDILNHWARFDITRLARKDIVEGFEDATFRPDIHITRAEFITTIARVISGKLNLENKDIEGLDLDTFCLCEQDHWAFPYIAYLRNLGILPYHDCQLIIDEFCPRAEVCTLLWRAAGMPGAVDTASDATAEAQPQQYLEEFESLDSESRKAVLWCIANGLLQGYGDGTLRLNQSITRAEAATIILRLLNMEQAGKINLLR